jgi:leucyl-tRNA---protein transferase
VRDGWSTLPGVDRRESLFYGWLRVPLELAHFVSEEQACEYLPRQRAVMEYRVLLGLEPEGLDRLLERGWRRFGPAVFRPACQGCGECISLRICADRFRISRSQRRARNRCATLQVEVGPPQVDDERLELYARWHAGREQARGWGSAPLDTEDYARSFGAVDGCAREVLYRDAGKLVGVGICDETARAWSAVYFFHDPEYARLSLGVNHVLTLIERARQDGKPYVYLGYRVWGCPSMRYKAGFLPHELLEGRPGAEQTARWQPVEQGPQPDEE